MTDNKNLTESPDFVQENDKSAARTEVTIKFGRGLIGDPFTSKNGKELVIVGVADNDKQGGLAVAYGIKLHFVGFHKVAQLFKVKGCKPRSAGNEDRASCLSRR